MNSQEIFNKVVTHLRTQGRKAVNGITCQYRAEDGAKCAAGCLIEDEDYTPDMENNLVSCPIVSRALAKYAAHLPLIESLQGVHDQQRVEDWEWVLAEVAHQYGLVMP